MLGRGVDDKVMVGLGRTGGCKGQSDAGGQRGRLRRAKRVIRKKTKGSWER